MNICFEEGVLGEMALESVRASTYKWCSVVRGHHVYKEVWTPVLGEELAVKKKENNGYNRYTFHHQECQY